MPFATKEGVGAELDRLECEGILKKVDHSVWAAPTVTVSKKDDRFHICGDYKVTVNRSLDIDQYPLPKRADLFSMLAGVRCLPNMISLKPIVYLQCIIRC